MVRDGKKIKVINLVIYHLLRIENLILQISLKPEAPKKCMFSKRLGREMAASAGTKSQNTKVID